MSPEQLLSNKDVGPSADMWSLAVVAFRGITGAAPFRGDTLAALSIAICSGEFRLPSELRPDLPSAVDQWFVRAFTRDPKARFSSPKELVSSFRAAFSGGVDPLADSSGSFSFVSADRAMQVSQPGLTAAAPPARPSSPTAVTVAPAVRPVGPPPPIAPPAERAVPAPAPLGAAPQMAVRTESSVGRQATEAVPAWDQAAAPPTDLGDSSSQPAHHRDEAPPPDVRAPQDSGVDLTPDSYGGLQPVVQQAADPGSLSGSMASLGGASASLQPPLSFPSRRRLRMPAVLGGAGALLVLLIIVAVSLGDESDEEGASMGTTARVGLPARQLASAVSQGVRVAPEGMVAIPAGTYPMGCDPQRNKGCFDDEMPRHYVKLERYAIMVHEVTVGDFGKCVASGTCRKPGVGKSCSFRQTGKPALPVTCVTWEAARTYCDFRSWRLPTEAEWEAAARGSEARAFPWGNQRPSCDRTVVGGSSRGGCGIRGPLAVGSKSADRSWAGVLDLGGNVREWTGSNYAAYPGGKAESGRSGKISRGTSWSIPPADADASYNRGVDKPDQSRPDLGFRCAVSL
jgi:formylglycine-generating enzyme required for sulfatase activity